MLVVVVVVYSDDFVSDLMLDWNGLQWIVAICAGSLFQRRFDWNKRCFLCKDGRFASHIIAEYFATNSSSWTNHSVFVLYDWSVVGTIPPLETAAAAVGTITPFGTAASAMATTPPFGTAASAMTTAPPLGTAASATGTTPPLGTAAKTTITTTTPPLGTAASAAGTRSPLERYLLWERQLYLTLVY